MFITDRSKAVLLLRIIFVIRFSCLSCFLVCLLPAGNRLTSWLSCVQCFIVFLLVSLVLSWARCGARLYQFLIFAFFLTCITSKKKKNRSRIEKLVLHNKDSILSKDSELGQTEKVKMQIDVGNNDPIKLDHIEHL